MPPAFVKPIINDFSPLFELRTSHHNYSNNPIGIEINGTTKSLKQAKQL